MKTYFSDLIPKLQRFSKQLDDLTILTNQHWVSVGDIGQAKKVFIFRPNNTLLISENGIVEKGSWEYLGKKSLLIETTKENYLMKHAFFDENVIALKIDSTDNYAFFVNENQSYNELNSAEDVLKFLNNKYLKNRSNPLEMDPLFNQTSINDINYSVLNEYNMFDFMLGNYTVYEIEFLNGLKGHVYKGKSSGKYYYIDNFNGLTYCLNFEAAVHKFYNSRQKS